MQQDILLDDDDDLKSENGDFAIGDSKFQDILQLLKTPKGTLRSNGYFGLNIVDIINEDDLSKLRGELRQQLKSDNKELTFFNIDDDGKLQVDAENI